MKLKDLDNKKIAILGLGVENYAMLKFLFGKIKNSEITVHDMRDKEALGEKYEELRSRVHPVKSQSRTGARSAFDRVNWIFGPTANQGLYKYDILFRAPGWPISCPGIREAMKKKKTILYSPIKLFFDLCPTKNLIGVTGTKGKGTTSSLIFEILKKAGKKVYLGGNIGIAPFEFLPKLKKTDWVVLELSSFQLEDLAASPKIAVLTNFYSEHLAPADPHNPNFHPTLKAYWNAKLNLIKWQKPGDAAILNKKIQDTRPTRFAIRSGRARYKIQTNADKKIYFGKSELPSRLPGEHNKENIAAAVEVAKLLKIKPAVIKKAVAKFKGLEHRLELAGEVAGVKYYNDSFATTPESTIIALKSFASAVVLLAGGADKGSNFKALAREIKKRVKFTVLLKGAATPRLEKELRAVGYPSARIEEVDNIKTAVKLATERAAGEGAVILSPGCASFGMFKNYKERGELFKEEVSKLK